MTLGQNRLVRSMQVVNHIAGIGGVYNIKINFPKRAMPTYYISQIADEIGARRNIAHSEYRRGNREVQE